MINEYNKITDQIVKAYLSKLSIEIYNEKLDYYDLMEYEWINQWPVIFSDMYFNLDDIFLAYKFNIPWKIFTDYYYLTLESYEKKEEWPWINLYNYWRKSVLNPEVIKKERQEDLKASKKRVEIAKEIFENAIERGKAKK